MQSLLHRFFALIYFFSSKAIEANPECDEENVNYGKKFKQRSDEHEAFNTGIALSHLVPSFDPMCSDLLPTIFLLPIVICP
jgi:hypothetical protein